MYLREVWSFYCGDEATCRLFGVVEEEKEMAGVHGRVEKEAFDELSVKVHQSSHIFKPPRWLFSALRLIFLHIVGNFSILARGIIHSWPI